MSTKTYMADQLGEPEEFEFKGKSFRVVPFDHLQVIPAFERWATRQAKAVTNSLRPNADDPEEANDKQLFADWLSHRDRCDARIDAGYFKFGNAGYIEASGTQGGYIQLVFLSLRVCHPTITREQVAEMFADEETQLLIFEAVGVVNDRTGKAKAAKMERLKAAAEAKAKEEQTQRANGVADSCESQSVNPNESATTLVLNG